MLSASIRSFIAIGAMIVAILPGEEVHADDGLVLAPATEWRFREYDDRCRASRVFGEGENRTTLWIEQGGEESNYNLTLIGRPLRHPYGRGVRVQFGEEPEIVRSYIAATSSRDRPVLRMYGVTVAQPELEREPDQPVPEIELDRQRAGNIRSLRLRTALMEPLTLELESLADAYSFLNLCGTKLSVFLSEAGRPLSGEATPPVPIDEGDWLRESDYPPYLIQARMGGELTARLTVNTAGKASGCFVVESNKPQLFDDAVCLGLLRRAEFEPARDSMGDAVPSYYFYKVRLSVR